MKKNNTILYVITGILCVFLGAAGMYGLIHFFPSVIVDTVTKTIKDVTVTDEGISEGINNIYDAVVTVQSSDKGGVTTLGSGFVYDEKGYVMTNHHVINGVKNIKLTLSNGQTIDASLVGSDQYADIAVLKVDPEKILKVAKIGSSQELELGDTTFAIGTPVDSEYAGTVTRGILSGKDRMVEVSVTNSNQNDWIMNVMQTDAAINPGNSGGPLCNVSGEVVGVNSIKIVQTTIEGIGFSIPIEDALDYANKIVSGGEIKRAYLGIEYADLTYSSYYFIREGIEIDPSVTAGVVIMSVAEDSPSEKAGLKKGDVIVKVGEYDIYSIAELKYYLYKHEPGETVKVKVMRGSKSKDFDVKLGQSE